MDAAANYLNAKEVAAQGGARSEGGRRLRSHHILHGHVALIDVGADDDRDADILRGHRASIFRGLPAHGRIDYMLGTAQDIGESNTNLTSSAQNGLDFFLLVEQLGFEIVYPRSLCDGAELLDTTFSFRPTDHLAGRKLASRYTRFHELFVGATHLVLAIGGEVRQRIPLEFVGSGLTTKVEGLAVSVGGTQGYDNGGEDLDADVVPSVAAFSAQLGHGRRDTYSLGEGLELDDETKFELYTVTDTDIVEVINTRLLANGFLHEDRFPGIRLKPTLEGQRYRRVGVGVRG